MKINKIFALSVIILLAGLFIVSAQILPQNVVLQGSSLLRDLVPAALLDYSLKTDDKTDKKINKTGQSSFAAFTPGNFVIYRVGDGTGTLSSAGTVVFLDEYTPTGTLVQSIAMPTTVSGSNRRLVASGTATTEGFLSRSVNGQYLVLAGYDADPGTASITTSTSTSVNRVIARVSVSGAIDTSTALTDAISGGNPRSVASTNGIDLWISGTSTGGGIRYTTLGSTTSTQIASSPTNLRVAGIFDGQLYISASTGTTRLATVGTGIPTSSGQAITNLPGYPTTGSPNGYFFADLSASVAGVDTVYVADDSSGNIQKYSLVSGNWVLNGSVSITSARGITGVVNANSVALFITNGSSLQTFTDSSGYNAPIVGTPTLLASAPANTAFRGIAPTPVIGGSPGTLQFSSSTYSLPENGGVATLVVSRTGGSTGAASVRVTTSDGTATGGASCGQSGVDYVSVDTTVSWSNGDSTDKSVPVTVCNDSLFEGNETVNVTLSNVSGATLGSPSTAVLTIIDDDPQPATVEFQQTSLTGNESQSVMVNVVRTGDTSGTSTVDFATSANTAIAGPDCGLNIDFASSSGTLTFAPGETLKSFAIRICPDRFSESLETFSVSLSSPSAGTVLGTNTSATVSINDTASEFRNTSAIQLQQGGAALLYPSIINVSGAAGPIATIRVTLYDVSHINNAADIDILLVAPDGRNIILMSDAGGPAGLPGPRTLTFTDDAGQVLPQNGAFLNAHYEPTSWTANQSNFPTPAPAGPYNEPGSAVGGSVTLASVFGGADPNGQWKLYVRDDNGTPVTAGATSGNIAGGWGIEIITQTGQPVELGGVVRTSDGRGISRAAIIISGGNLSQPLITYSNNFGFYRFSGLQSGQSYSVQVLQSKYVFNPSVFNVTLTGTLQGGDIVSSTTP